MQAHRRDCVNILMISVRADIGGGPEHMYRLAQNLSSDFRVFMVCPREAPYWERFKELVGENRIIEIPHRQFTLFHLYKLCRFIKDCRIDIIHSHGKGAGIYGRIAGGLTRKPVIHTFHGIHTGEYNWWKKILYIKLEQVLAGITARLISVSPSEAEHIRALRLCPAKKLAIIPNGVVLPRQKTATLKPDGILKIITVTRFDYAKNAELALAVFQSLQDGQDRFQLHFLGNGPDMATVMQRSETAGLHNRVFFHGFVESIENYLQDAFCYLSTSRWEGLPLALLEASANGIPVVATNVVGNVDVIQHGINGLLYDLKKPEEAGKYLLQLAAAPSLWQSLSQNGEMIARNNFSVERMAEDTGKLYGQLVQKRTGMKDGVGL